MPYLVPPPNPPAIVDVLPPGDSNPSKQTSIATSEQPASNQTLGVTSSYNSASICAPERLPDPCNDKSSVEGTRSDADALGAPIELAPEQAELTPVRYGSSSGGTEVDRSDQRNQAESLPPAPPQGENMRLLGLPVVAQTRQPGSSVPDLPAVEPASPDSLDLEPAPESPRQPTLQPDQPDQEVERQPTEPDASEPATVSPNAEPSPLGDRRPAQPTLDLPQPVPTPESGEVLTIPEQGEGTSPTESPGQPTNPADLLPTDPSGTGGVIELDADRQEYDTIRRVFVAEGNVELRFRGSVLRSDAVRVNLPNRIAVAEGDAILARGEQVIEGDRFEYNFVRGEGTVYNARGEIFVPSAGSDFAPTLPTDVSADTATNRLLSDRIAANQPPVQAAASGSGISVTLGAGEDLESGIEGAVNRIRFEAERINFYPEGWQASNVRLTNDPFSPPELELRSPQVTYTRQSPTRSEVRARNPRIVFDQGFSLPFLRDRVVIDRRERDPGLLQFGFDEEERGGLFVERSFDLLTTPAVRFSLTPQFYLQRALTDSGGNVFDPANYGITAEFDAQIDQRTALEGNAVITTFAPDNFADETRASLRARRRIGNHTLALEYSYRDRLFNGSLGYQDVQSSLGAVLTSPSIALGDTGIELSYQVGAQYITANTDREELRLSDDSDDREGSLGRFQASAALSRGFPLWQGTPLPATPTEGLRYTSYPLVPYLQVYTGARGVYSNYTNGENQATLTGSVGLQGQFGHFSRPFLDYTAFNLTYSQTLREGESPFFFDRADDRQVISAGIVQQIYGPFRFGLQTSINLDREREIDTDYSLEYSRRTYSITLRFNPVREVGSLRLRINDFNWTGNPGRFSGDDRSSVTGGVQRLQD